MNNKADLEINGVKYAIRKVPNTKQWCIWCSLGGRCRLPELWDSMPEAITAALDHAQARIK
jgi:hypothetical protein